MDKLLYGAAYYEEYLPYDRLEQDVKMMEEAGEDLDAMELCFQKPGAGPLYEAAAKYCPHAACPVTAGILKCIEAECKMALPKDVSIRFV